MPANLQASRHEPKIHEENLPFPLSGTHETSATLQTKNESFTQDPLEIIAFATLLLFGMFSLFFVLDFSHSLFLVHSISTFDISYIDNFDYIRVSIFLIEMVFFFY